MRHRKAIRKLGRTTAHRSAMLRNMVTSLIQHERIETTDAKAKELRRLADKMVTLAKRGDLHARRQAMAVVRTKGAAHKLFTEIRERFLSRTGGYTRILKKGFRVGDGAPLSIIELVPAGYDKTQKIKKGKKGVEKPEKKKAEKAAQPSKAPAAKKAEDKPQAAAPAATPVPEQTGPAEPEAAQTPAEEPEKS